MERRVAGVLLQHLNDGIMAAAATLATYVLFFEPVVFAQPASDSLGELLVGKAAFGDWRTDAPLVRRKITDLPPPYATRSASNPPRVIAKPVSAAPKVPPGFQVELFVSNLRDPRMVRVAPNGDIFIAEAEPGRIRVLRAGDGEAKPSSNEVFVSGLDQPFGIAFYPPGSDPLWMSPIRDLWSAIPIEMVISKRAGKPR
jgi:glucose/arabinose dehydrogenase